MKKKFEVAFVAAYIVEVEADDEEDAVTVFDRLLDPKKNAQQIGNYMIDYIEEKGESHAN